MEYGVWTCVPWTQVHGCDQHHSLAIANIANHEYLLMLQTHHFCDVETVAASVGSLPDDIILL